MPFATPDTGLVAVTIEVHYTVDLAGSHLALDAELFVSSDQLRRSRSWMPCVDDPTVFCSWDLYLQVCFLGCCWAVSIVSVILGPPSPGPYLRNNCTF